MPVTALSAVELTALEDNLKKIATASVGTEASALSVSDISTEFCTIWPKASPILTLVGKYIGFIPGVGTAAGVIITGLVTAGDAMSKVVCPKT